MFKLSGASVTALLICGSSAGLFMGALSTRLLGQIVYGATPRDPLVWGGVLLTMVCLGIFATWVPAKRALATDPDVLLMDEPFAALDAQTRDLMQVELLRIWREARKTVLFVTHQIDEAIYLSDRVLVMSKRPGRSKKIFDIKLPRPREYEMRVTPEFNDLKLEIWNTLKDEIVS